MSEIQTPSEVVADISNTTWCREFDPDFRLEPELLLYEWQKSIQSDAIESTVKRCAELITKVGDKGLSAKAFMDQFYTEDFRTRKRCAEQILSLIPQKEGKV